jgi:cytochrome c oxidase subunit 2
MRIFWTLVFLFIPVLGVGLLLWSSLMPGGWLPENVSSIGEPIDMLFYLITGITGFFFVATELLLVYAIFTGRGGSDGKAVYTHGHRGLEIGWTLMTAGILLFVAFIQLPTWARAKFISNFKEAHPDVKPMALVVASQFEWQTRYPVWDEKAGKPKELNWKNPDFRDSFELYNEMHVPAGEPILIHLTSRDVIHSFWIPAMRVKQDALPGNVVPVWFDASKIDPSTFGDKKTREFVWVCAELCGWGHYRMQARVVVHATREDYYQWLKDKTAEQTQPKLPGEKANKPEG